MLRTLLHTVEVPLFPRYAFVLLDGASWAAIGYTPGVHRLLMADGQPQRVNAAALEAVQAAEGAARVETASALVWAPGAACILLQGPFSKLPAVVLSVAGRQARVGILLMGDLRTVRAPVSWLASREE